MQIALCPSGVSWLDLNVGGIPVRGTLSVLGEARSGKTSVGISFALSAMARGPVCLVTTDTPNEVLSFAQHYFERDLEPAIRSRRLTLLQFSPFFESKSRSMGSIEGPFAELRRLCSEREIQSVVFDTFDPVLNWFDASNAKPLVRSVLHGLGSLGVTSVCTLRGSSRSLTLGASEFMAAADGAIELMEEHASPLLRVHTASWCNVENVDVPFEFVLGKGLMAREGETSRHTPLRLDYDVNALHRSRGRPNGDPMTRVAPHRARDGGGSRPVVAPLGSPRDEDRTIQNPRREGARRAPIPGASQPKKVP